jgi:hypothetical protein
VIHRKLHILALAALAALAAGCAFEAPASEEPVQQTQGELTKANSPSVTKTATLTDEATGASTQITVPVVVNIIKTDNVLSGGGETDDGPRPHPWEPNPEQSGDSTKTTETNTNTNNSGTGSSPTK